jgi:hypothetical protein
LHRGEPLGDDRVLAVRDQVLAALRAADFVSALEQRLERAEGLQQLGGGLLADARNAGDVVGGVALQAVEVRDLLRRDAVALDHRGAVVELGLGDPTGGRHHGHQPPLVDQLERVAVAGHDRDGDPLLDRALRDRRNHIVGLEAVQARVAIAERLDERLERRPLLAQQVGARLPLSLVRGVGLGAPRGSRVPRHDRRRGAVLRDQLDEHRSEAEDRVGRLAGRGGDGLRQRKESAVDEAVAVYQEHRGR